MRSNYEEKRANRIERYNRLVIKFQGESESRYKRFHDLLRVIPPGQPILVGHHSEAGHRSLLKKADNNMRKSIEADKKSTYYERKAEIAESNYAISSDDPNAPERLQEKLEKLVKLQEFYKIVNKTVRSKKLSENQKTEKLVSLGVKEATAIEFIQPDQYGRLGIPGYRLTNNNATIKTVKQRIAKLQAIEKHGNEEQTYGDIRVFANADENRVQIFFPGKPSEEIRKALKGYGYRWSPTSMCWQAFYSNRAKYTAIEVVKLANATT